MNITVCIEVTDLPGDQMSQVTGTFTIHVNPSGPPPNPLTLTPPGGKLPDETQGTATSDAVATVSGGQQPYSFALSSGALPDGVALAQSNNPDGSVLVSLSGTPTTPGDFSFDLQVTDAAGATAGSFSGTVAPRA